MVEENNIDMFEKFKKWAVVGASPKKEKYGYKVFKTLVGRGFAVYPVHVAAKEIDGFKVYPNISSLPEVPEAVVLIIPPDKTLPVLKDMVRLNIRNVWFQPGSESDEAIEFCKKNNINFVARACIMMDVSPESFRFEV
ncbi:CoA-binding domain protein [Thermodesulfobium narugense DSM 14796]|uniref:CoA-binding domain protein n=1 Tax=Thermodesulfobium narugense DSM 14796 TaxID=747365 RepID=M1E6G8_9BACT|nr:CoA-binding protein [Thermodesulfobium narugense]AEE14791.1 CoA-binding domain protein [Thermodesulfobium narugense DSM 14796]